MGMVYDEQDVVYLDEPAHYEEVPATLSQSHYPSQPTVQRVYSNVRNVVQPRRVMNNAQVGYHQRDNRQIIQPNRVVLVPQNSRQPLPMANAYQTQVEPVSTENHYQPDVLPFHRHRAQACQRSNPQANMGTVSQPRYYRYVKRPDPKPLTEVKTSDQSRTLVHDAQFNNQPVGQVFQSQARVPYFPPGERTEKAETKLGQIARVQRIRVPAAYSRQMAMQAVAPTRELVRNQNYQTPLPMRRNPQVSINKPPVPGRYPTASTIVSQKMPVRNVGQQNLMFTRPVNKMLGSQPGKPNYIPKHESYFSPEKKATKMTIFEPSLKKNVKKVTRLSAREKQSIILRGWWTEEKSKWIDYKNPFPLVTMGSDPFLTECHTNLTHAASPSARMVIVDLVVFNNKVRKDTNIFTDREIYVREFMLFKSGISYRYRTTNLFPFARHPPAAADGYFPAQFDTREKQGKYLLERYEEAVVLYQTLNPAIERARQFMQDNQFKLIDMDWRCLQDWHTSGRHIHGFFFIAKNALTQRNYLLDMFNLIVFPFYCPYSHWEEDLKRAFDIVTAYNLNLAEVYRRNRKFINTIEHKLTQPYQEIEDLSEIDNARKQDEALFSTCENLIYGGIKKTLRGLPTRKHPVFEYAYSLGLNISCRPMKDINFDLIENGISDDDEDEDELSIFDKFGYYPMSQTSCSEKPVSKIHEEQKKHEELSSSFDVDQPSTSSIMNDEFDECHKPEPAAPAELFLESTDYDNILPESVLDSPIRAATPFEKQLEENNVDLEGYDQLLRRHNFKPCKTSEREHSVVSTFDGFDEQEWEKRTVSRARSEKVTQHRNSANEKTTTFKAKKALRLRRVRMQQLQRMKKKRWSSRENDSILNTVLEDNADLHTDENTQITADNYINKLHEQLEELGDIYEAPLVESAEVDDLPMETDLTKKEVVWFDRSEPVASSVSDSFKRKLEEENDFERPKKLSKISDDKLEDIMEQEAEKLESFEKVGDLVDDGEIPQCVEEATIQTEEIDCLLDKPIDSADNDQYIAQAVEELLSSLEEASETTVEIEKTVHQENHVEETPEEVVEVEEEITSSVDASEKVENTIIAPVKIVEKSELTLIDLMAIENAVYGIVDIVEIDQNIMDESRIAVAAENFDDVLEVVPVVDAKEVELQYVATIVEEIPEDVASAVKIHTDAVESSDVVASLKIVSAAEDPLDHVATEVHNDVMETLNLVEDVDEAVRKVVEDAEEPSVVAEKLLDPVASMEVHHDVLEASNVVEDAGEAVSKVLDETEEPSVVAEKMLDPVACMELHHDVLKASNVVEDAGEAISRVLDETEEPLRTAVSEQTLDFVASVENHNVMMEDSNDFADISVVIENAIEFVSKAEDKTEESLEAAVVAVEPFEHVANSMEVQSDVVEDASEAVSKIVDETEEALKVADAAAAEEPFEHVANSMEVQSNAMETSNVVEDASEAVSKVVVEAEEPLKVADATEETFERVDISMEVHNNVVETSNVVEDAGEAASKVLDEVEEPLKLTAVAEETLDFVSSKENHDVMMEESNHVAEISYVVENAIEVASKAVNETEEPLEAFAEKTLEHVDSLEEQNVMMGYLNDGAETSNVVEMIDEAVGKDLIENEEPLVVSAIAGDSLHTDAETTVIDATKEINIIQDVGDEPIVGGSENVEESLETCEVTKRSLNELVVTPANSATVGEFVDSNRGPLEYVEAPKDKATESRINLQEPAENGQFEEDVNDPTTDGDTSNENDPAYVKRLMRYMKEVDNDEREFEKNNQNGDLMEEVNISSQEPQKETPSGTEQNTSRKRPEKDNSLLSEPPAKRSPNAEMPQNESQDRTKNDGTKILFEATSEEGPYFVQTHPATWTQKLSVERVQIPRIDDNSQHDEENNLQTVEIKTCCNIDQFNQMAEKMKNNTKMGNNTPFNGSTTMSTNIHYHEQQRSESQLNVPPPPFASPSNQPVPPIPSTYPVHIPSTYVKEICNFDGTKILITNREITEGKCYLKDLRIGAYNVTDLQVNCTTQVNKFYELQLNGTIVEFPYSNLTAKNLNVNIIELKPATLMGSTPYKIGTTEKKDFFICSSKKVRNQIPDAEGGVVYYRHAWFNRAFYGDFDVRLTHQKTFEGVCMGCMPKKIMHVKSCLCDHTFRTESIRTEFTDPSIRTRRIIIGKFVCSHRPSNYLEILPKLLPELLKDVHTEEETGFESSNMHTSPIEHCTSYFAQQYSMYPEAPTYQNQYLPYQPVVRPNWPPGQMPQQYLATTPADRFLLSQQVQDYQYAPNYPPQLQGPYANESEPCMIEGCHCDKMHFLPQEASFHSSEPSTSQYQQTSYQNAQHGGSVSYSSFEGYSEVISSYPLNETSTQNCEESFVNNSQLDNLTEARAYEQDGSVQWEVFPAETPEVYKDFDVAHEVEIDEDYDRCDAKSIEIAALKAFSERIDNTLVKRGNRPFVDYRIDEPFSVVRSKSVEAVLRKPYKPLESIPPIKRSISALKLTELASHVAKKTAATQMKIGRYLENKNHELLELLDKDYKEQLGTFEALFTRNSLLMRATKFSMAKSFLTKTKNDYVLDKVPGQEEAEKYGDILHNFELATLQAYRGEKKTSNIPRFEGMTMTRGKSISLTMDAYLRFQCFKRKLLASANQTIDKVKTLKHKKNKTYYALIDAIEVSLKFRQASLEEVLNDIGMKLFNPLFTMQAEALHNRDQMDMLFTKLMSEMTNVHQQMFPWGPVESFVKELQDIPNIVAKSRFANNGKALALITLERNRADRVRAEIIRQRKDVTKMVPFKASVDLLTLNLEEVVPETSVLKTLFDTAKLFNIPLHYISSQVNDIDLHRKAPLKTIVHAFFNQLKKFYLTLEKSLGEQIDKKVLMYLENESFCQLLRMIHGTGGFFSEADFKRSNEITNGLIVSAMAFATKKEYDMQLHANMIYEMTDEQLVNAPKPPMLEPLSLGVMFDFSSNCMRISSLIEHKIVLERDRRVDKDRYRKFPKCEGDQSQIVLVDGMRCNIIVKNQNTTLMVQLLDEEDHAITDEIVFATITDKRLIRRLDWNTVMNIFESRLNQINWVVPTSRIPPDWLYRTNDNPEGFPYERTPNQKFSFVRWLAERKPIAKLQTDASNVKGDITLDRRNLEKHVIAKTEEVVVNAAASKEQAKISHQDLGCRNPSLKQIDRDERAKSVHSWEGRSVEEQFEGHLDAPMSLADGRPYNCKQYLEKDVERQNTDGEQASTSQDQFAARSFVEAPEVPASDVVLDVPNARVLELHPNDEAYAHIEEKDYDSFSEDESNEA